MKPPRSSQTRMRPSWSAGSCGEAHVGEIIQPNVLNTLAELIEQGALRAPVGSRRPHSSRSERAAANAIRECASITDRVERAKWFQSCVTAYLACHRNPLANPRCRLPVRSYLNRLSKHHLRYLPSFPSDQTLDFCAGWHPKKGP